MTLPPGVGAVVVGVVGTLTMDIVGGGVLRRLGILRLLPIGRWAAYLVHGKARHEDITKSPPIRGERSITALVHYAIGITLASFYLAALGWFGFGPPAWWTAIPYGLATSILPFLLMFPSMGYGFFGLKSQPKYFLLRQSLVNHFFFGVGLWLGSLLL
ncbi:MAG TPA: DUF2938 family protein [Thermoplasmata archaeon]